MVKNKNFIAYKGKEFTIEWYYNDQGNSPALEYYLQLPLARQIKFAKLLQWMGDVGEIRNKEKFRNEGEQIFAFKPQPDRFFCFFFTGSKIIVTNAYEKKADKMSQKDHVKALIAYQDYVIRTKQGKYYEKNNR